MKILLTGCTGFLGSHIAGKLCSHGHTVLGIKRSLSHLDNCSGIANRINWLDCDTDNWLEEAILFNAEIIIHAAWCGVDSLERDNWTVQLNNIEFFSKLLYITERTNVKKIIALGSQAEYGQYSECINEEFPVNPSTKYGIVKLCVLRMLSSFAKLHNIDWYWLRVFSVYGERESVDWLLPSVITQMLSGAQEMDFTKGEQKYSYLYVKDLANAVYSVCNSKNKSGIYNISSSKVYRLTEILAYIKSLINPCFQLNFGKLPYRPGQSMFLGGDSSKFISAFGEFEKSEFYAQLLSLIAYYKNKINETF